MRWRSAVTAAFVAGCFVACGESERPHEPREASDAGSDAPSEAGPPSCLDRRNSADIELLQLRATHGACTSDADCVIVPEDGDCFDTCAGSVAAGEEAAFAEGLAGLSDDICPALAECTTWHRPDRCAPQSGYCDPDSSLCVPVCAAALDFQARGGSDGTCGGNACPAFPDPPDGRLRYRMSCCTDEGACGSGSPEFFGDACFERDQPGTPNTECPDGSVFLYVDLGSYASVGDYFEGCCRPDGLCGFDTSRTLGAGCVERSELSHAVENGCSGYEPLPPFESIPCSP